VGNGILIGGANNNADVFVFKNGPGNNTICDWEDGFDLMDVSGHTGVIGIGDLTIDQSSGAIDGADFIF